jgi:hypothetical protein
VWTATSSRAEFPFYNALSEISLQEPKKQPKKEPPKKEPKKGELKAPKELKIEIKKEVVARDVLFRVPGWAPIGVAYGYWPGPVLPGMWGGVWGGLWPDSWWLGGPYLYAGWTGPWAGGYAYGPGLFGHGWQDDHAFWKGGGAWPRILPPMFSPQIYPAVSPYWVPRVAPFWMVPGAAPPAVIGSAEPAKKPVRVYRPVPNGASVDKLYADAQWLFWEDNFQSARDHLAAAIKQSPQDARMWYLMALAERALGDDAAAQKSAENGAALEILGTTEKRSILLALERIQGPDRKFLEDLVTGPRALSVASARAIVSQLNAGTTVSSAR